MREIAEETGLTPGDFETEEGWHCVLAAPRIAQVRVLHAHATAAELRARMLAHLAASGSPSSPISASCAARPISTR